LLKGSRAMTTAEDFPGVEIWRAILAQGEPRHDDR
jgi:hypothetical protein